MERNDYTFIQRLDKLSDEYKREEKGKDLDDWPRFRIRIRICDWIEEIKEDMRLKALQTAIDLWS